MRGFIVLEPDLRIEEVPEHLHAAEDILWPAHLNTLSEVEPGRRAPMLDVSALYHRYTVNREGAFAYIWTRRDADGLPGRVLIEILGHIGRDAGSP
jgi:hypothetical protein